MPHFGSIDKNLDEKYQDLMRFRLHYRAGYERIKLGKIPIGIGTLYDALIYAIKYFSIIHKEIYPILKDTNFDKTEEEKIFKILQKSNILQSKFDIEQFNGIVHEDMNDIQRLEKFYLIEEDLKKLLFELEVLPFNDKDLPPINEKIL